MIRRTFIVSRVFIVNKKRQFVVRVNNAFEPEMSIYIRYELYGMSFCFFGVFSCRKIYTFFGI